MQKELLDFVVKETKALIAAPSCCPELKAVADAWLKAVGTASEGAETQKYIKEIEEDIMPIDGLIAFASSPMGEKVFGAEVAKKVASHGKEIKAKGAKYCDCPACAACEAILKKKAEILK